MANRYYQGFSEFHCYATRVTTSSMRLGVGTLERDMPRPAEAQVRLCNDSGGEVDVKKIQPASEQARRTGKFSAPQASARCRSNCP